MSTKSQISELDALFNPQVDMGDTASTTNAAAKEEYSPTAEKGKNKIYQSIIRFVPWHAAPKKSIKDKWTCWLINPITSRGRFVDCPSSVGKPSLLQDMYFKLKKSENIKLQKQADIFSRRHSYAALVQIIKDDHNPDLAGKIMVFRFGKKLWDKINAEKKPLVGDPHEPFDILNGKLFALIITQQAVTENGKTRTFNNYDQSKFLDKVLPLHMFENEKLVPITSKTDKLKVLEYLKANSPDLDKYDFKDWDQETTDYVNSVILAVTGQGSVAQNYSGVLESNKQNKPAASAPSKGIDLGTSAGTGISSENLSIDDLDNLSSAPGLEDLDDLPGIGGDLGEIMNGL